MTKAEAIRWARREIAMEIRSRLAEVPDRIGDAAHVERVQAHPPTAGQGGPDEVPNGRQPKLAVLTDNRRMESSSDQTETGILLEMACRRGGVVRVGVPELWLELDHLARWTAQL